jgi:hypothetical protein
LIAYIRTVSAQCHHVAPFRVSKDRKQEESQLTFNSGLTSAMKHTLYREHIDIEST